MHHYDAYLLDHHSTSCLNSNLQVQYLHQQEYFLLSANTSLMCTLMVVLVACNMYVWVVHIIISFRLRQLSFTTIACSIGHLPEKSSSL